MSGRVIQGSFTGGRARSPVGAAGPAAVQRAVAAGAPRSMPGPPPPVAGRSIAIQTRPAPGRPPIAHHAAQVAQAFGGGDSFEIDPAQIGIARDGGQPLPPPVLAKMESAFSADFSSVRVHVGPQAPRIGAVAFTMGENLYFAPGQYRPESIQGQQLIGHELAHVIQQRQGRVRAPGSGVAVVQDRALEAEADRLGMRAAAHRPVVQAKWDSAGRPSWRTTGPTAHPTFRRFPAGRRFDRQAVQRSFLASGVPFNLPPTFAFTTASAQQAITPMPHGTIPSLVGAPAGSGVGVGDIGSKAAIDHAEVVGDKLTGDHQPSGAAVKENIRILLHAALAQVLTRSQARIAYQKAITIVMTDAWHEALSRTYGGRNTKAQIAADAADMTTATIKDWMVAAPELLKTMTPKGVQEIWDSFNKARENFFNTGDPQYIPL